MLFQIMFIWLQVKNKMIFYLFILLLLNNNPGLYQFSHRLSYFLIK